jgi:prolyl-tRNA editing enzyme YbaK/EbsC (Cys-tRNA(Pro) deacylase)
MIKDFLEANNLNGKVFSFPSDISLEKAMQEAHLSQGSVAKTFVFVDEKMDFFGVISQVDSSISAKEACSLFKKKFLEEASSEEVLRLTGFKKEFFPPVSVFGLRVILHPSIISKKRLLFALSNREFLSINTEDILRISEEEEEFSL